MPEYSQLEGEVGLKWFLGRAGVYPVARVRALIRRGQLTVNGVVPTEEQLVREGDRLRVHRYEYVVVPGGGRGRLLLKPLSEAPARISGKVRLQSGYHKCLTMFFRKVLGHTLPGGEGEEGGFRHFFHREDVFMREAAHYAVTSLSCHLVDFDKFDDLIVTRFVRDPRDLLISGYFYHKRSGEPFCDFLDPNEHDYEVVKGTVPAALGANKSLSQYLNESSVEDGLLAEIDFRRKHFENMMAWPADGPSIRTYRYEEVMGREAQTFYDIMRFYKFSRVDALRAGYYGRKLSAKHRSGKTAHIRNPTSGQWAKHFTPKVADKFNALYSDLLEQLEYPVNAQRPKG